MKSPSVLLLAAFLAGATPAAAAAQTAFDMAPDGKTLVHRQSGTRFPQQLAGFRRTSEHVFDSQGEYIGVGYQLPLRDGQRIRIRIAAVHIEKMTPQEHFVIAKPLGLKGLTDIKIVSEGVYDRPGKGADGYRGIYDARDQGRPVTVGLWAFNRGYWSLRGWAEYPASDNGRARARIDRFVDAFVALDQPYRTPTE